MPADAPIVAELGSRVVRLIDRLNVVVIVLIFAVIYMQQRRIHTGWITNYGNDVLGTAWAWWIARRGLDRRLARLGAQRRAAELVAALVLAAGLAYEAAKVLRLIRGTFDPLNVIAYAATLALCYAVERLLRRRWAMRFS